MVAVSSPWASEQMVARVQDLAGRLGGAVIVAHVVKPTEEDETEEQARQRGEQALETLTKPLIEAGIAAEGILLFGDDVARALLNASKSQRATLLVVGLSGKGRMARLLAGDVPHTVGRNADLPVLLFPPDWSGTV